MGSTLNSLHNTKQAELRLGEAAYNPFYTQIGEWADEKHLKVFFCPVRPTWGLKEGRGKRRGETEKSEMNAQVHTSIQV